MVKPPHRGDHGQTVKIINCQDGDSFISLTKSRIVLHGTRKLVSLSCSARFDFDKLAYFFWVKWKGYNDRMLKKGNVGLDLEILLKVVSQSLTMMRYALGLPQCGTQRFYDMICLDQCRKTNAKLSKNVSIRSMLSMSRISSKLCL